MWIQIVIFRPLQKNPGDDVIMMMMMSILILMIRYNIILMCLLMWNADVIRALIY